MVGLNRFLFGYRKLTVSADGRTALFNTCLKLGITFRTERRCEILISERDYAKLSARLESPNKYGFSVSEPRGAPALLRHAIRRWPLVVAILISLAVNILFSETIFDIRVSGNDTVPDYIITEALQKAGVSEGVLWYKLDLNRAETLTLTELPEISWINVNRRGSVAYVEVVESKGAISVPKDTGVCNVVADRDCVIREINVTSGVAVVKPGDVVKRGDVLISGTVESEFGTELVHASGSVIGETAAEIVGSALRSEKASLGTESHLGEIRLNIFNLSINIFKNYRNSPSECDIIEDNETLVVFSDKSLPFGITRVYERVRRFGEVEYTDSRMIELAYSRHSRALLAYLSGAELVKIKTEGKRTDTGYTVSSSIVYSCDVGEEKIIIVDSLGE